MVMKGWAYGADHAKSIARSYVRSLNKALKAEGKESFKKKDFILAIG